MGGGEDNHWKGRRLDGEIRVGRSQREARSQNLQKKVQIFGWRERMKRTELHPSRLSLERRNKKSCRFLQGKGCRPGVAGTVTAGMEEKILGGSKIKQSYKKGSLRESQLCRGDGATRM